MIKLLIWITISWIHSFVQHLLAIFISTCAHLRFVTSVHISDTIKYNVVGTFMFCRMLNIQFLLARIYAYNQSFLC